jgi:hypothetical protein
VPHRNDDGHLTVSDCAVAVNPGGFVAVPVMQIAAGYQFTPKLAGALTARIQLSRGEGALAGTLIGARGEYLLLSPAKGLRLSGLASFGIGQMQARPPPQKPGIKNLGPFATNGAVGGLGAVLTLGTKIGYRFTPNIGVNITPALNFGIPNFLFALDVLGGVELAL